MAKIVVMPKLGLTMKEGTIVKWRKNEGEPVQSGEVLLEVATDKLTNEIEANESGIVRKLMAKEGDTVECLKAIAVIAAADEDISEILKEAGDAEETATATETPAAAETVYAKSKIRVKAAPAARKLAEEKGIDIELVPGTGPEGRIVIKDVEDFIESEKTRTKVSPMAAKLAKELNVNVDEIGKNGRVMKEDVLSFAARGAEAAAPQETRVKMSPMRKVIASRMHESWSASPAVSYDIRVDTSSLKKVKECLNDICKVTYTDLLVKILSKALIEFPLVNCSVDGEELVMKNYVNMGVAVAVEGGLVVPVIKNVEKMGLKDISEAVRKMASKAKDGTLNPEDMQGGSFTITNLGTFGIESFSPIINQPEVAILGVNKIGDTPVVINGEVGVRPIMNLSLTADHRAVDGAVAAQFLMRVKELIEKPEMLLL